MLCITIYIYIYIYIYTMLYPYLYSIMCIYIYIYREREREMLIYVLKQHNTQMKLVSIAGLLQSGRSCCMLFQRGWFRYHLASKGLLWIMRLTYKETIQCYIPEASLHRNFKSSRWEIQISGSWLVSNLGLYVLLTSLSLSRLLSWLLSLSLVVVIVVVVVVVVSLLLCHACVSGGRAPLSAVQGHEEPAPPDNEGTPK